MLRDMHDGIERGIGRPAGRRVRLAAASVLAGVLASCGGSSDLVDSLRSSSNPTTPATVTETNVTTEAVPGATDAPPASTAGEPPATTATVEEPLIRFTPQTFNDPAANGVDAFSVLVPEGWQASGSVQWLPYWSRLAFVQTRVADPVTGITIDYLPIQDFLWFPAPAGFEVPIGGNYQGKAYVAPITDPAVFVREFWMPNDLSNLQNAQLVSIVEVPQVAAEFVTQFGGPAEAAAYRLRYEYEQDGQVWEQDVSFDTVRAPKGEIDRNASVISTVLASRITTTEWEATRTLVGQLFYQGLQQQMADTVRFGELLAQYRAESIALQQQVTDDRLASQDRQAEVFRETLGGVETYNDPVNGGLVQLPLGWNTYWVNEQGEYLAVDQPGFDPNTLNDGTWQQLEVQPH
ncbi:MAG: hypothetical protein FD127_3374 [Acidimicrobiaceae bacterium]|nr:MAG: hypothetical protein FD127_3374 [Acidimicrobiaceae bacterium]